MKITAVITALDEGPQLEVTVAHACAMDPPAHEIIVVDDGSARPIRERLGSFPQVRIVRHDEPIGCAVSRYDGALAAWEGPEGGADAVVFFDGHVHPPIDLVTYMRDSLEAHPDAMFCCGSSNIIAGSKPFGVGMGYTHDYADGICGKWLGLKWLRPGDAAIDEVPALMGQAYWVRRETWERSGGVTRTNRSTGYSELDMSLRVWMAGGRIMRLNRIHVPHFYYRSRKQREKIHWPKRSSQGLNLLNVVHALFGRAERDRFIPHVERVQGRWPIRWHRRAAEASFRERRRFLDLKPDLNLDRLRERCGFYLPTDEQLEATTQKILAKKAGGSAPAPKWSTPPATADPYAAYLAHQAEKARQPTVQRWGKGERRAKRIAWFTDRFRRNNVSGRALCLGARYGEEVEALRSLGVDAIGWDLDARPPLVVKGDMNDLSGVEAASLDLVYTNAIDHCWDPAAFCAGIERVLQPGGLLLMHVAYTGTRPGRYETHAWRDVRDLRVHLPGCALKAETPLRPFYGMTTELRFIRRTGGDA